jgi:hypothetical protein
MSLETNFVFGESKSYSENIKIATCLNQPKDSYFLRKEIKDHNVYIESFDPHPTLKNVQRAVLVHTITEGSFRQTWKWENEISEEDADAYLAEMLKDPTLSQTITVLKREIGLLVVRYDYLGCCTDWSPWLLQWGLATNYTKMEVMSDSASFFCLTHTEGTIGSWNRVNKDIPSGASSNIEKVDTICKVIFSQEVECEGEVLEAYKLYNLTSDKTVTNLSNKFCKVLRVSK